MSTGRPRSWLPTLQSYSHDGLLLCFQDLRWSWSPPSAHGNSQTQLRRSSPTSKNTQAPPALLFLEWGRTFIREPNQDILPAGAREEQPQQNQPSSSSWGQHPADALHHLLIRHLLPHSLTQAGVSCSAQHYSAHPSTPLLWEKVLKVLPLTTGEKIPLKAQWNLLFKWKRKASHYQKNNLTIPAVTLIPFSTCYGWFSILPTPRKDKNL